jgi:segregation and condensation protein B
MSPTQKPWERSRNMQERTQSDPVLTSTESSAPENPGCSGLSRAIEAVLLTLDKPVSPGKLAEGLGVGVDDGGSKAVLDAIDALNGEYEASDRAFRIEKVAGGVRIMTLPAYADALSSFHQARQSQRLSRPALETLAVVAYRQPMTRASLEAIRGVACGEVLRTLIERRMVTVTGRAEELGRPMLYGTTKQFLELFGLASLKDLPSVEDGAFAALLEAKPMLAESEPTDGTAASDDAEDADQTHEASDEHESTMQESIQ